MVTEDGLLAVVDEAFATTGRGFARWDDPHWGRSPADDEYSRVSDPARLRIIGARADAWLLALAGTGLATVERDVTVAWRRAPHTHVTRADRAVPAAPAALPLVVARSRIEGVDDAGVTLGAGDPADWTTWVPHCGCDACDGGSQSELDQLDRAILEVVRGFRRLVRGDRRVVAHADGSWDASDVPADEARALLAGPRPAPGWEDVTSAPWL